MVHGSDPKPEFVDSVTQSGRHGATQLMPHLGEVHNSQPRAVTSSCVCAVQPIENRNPSAQAVESNDDLGHSRLPSWFRNNANYVNH